jgi:hypothetical protein
MTGKEERTWWCERTACGDAGNGGANERGGANGHGGSEGIGGREKMTGKEERCGVTKISLFLKFKMTKVPLCRLVYIHTSVIISFLILERFNLSKHKSFSFSRA